MWEWWGGIRENGEGRMKKIGYCYWIFHWIEKLAEEGVRLRGRIEKY